MMVALLVVVGCPAAAERITSDAPAPVADAPDPGADLWQARLRYAVAIRSGAERAATGNLAYQGVSPNDFSLGFRAFPLLDRHLGLEAGLQREAFALFDGTSDVTGGGLLRADLGVSGRLRVARLLGLDATVGYAFQQVPLFGAATTFQAIGRHALRLAARAVVDLGPVMLEGRFEYPLVLGTTVAQVGSSGLGAGGGVRVHVLQLDGLDWGAMADVTWHSDTTTRAGALATQRIVRAGVALDVRARRAAPVTTGRVTLRLTIDGAPAAWPLIVQTPTGPLQVTTRADGTAELPQVRAGVLSVKAVKDGWLGGEAQGELRAGDELALALALTKAPPTVGTLRLVLASKDPAMSLSQTSVAIMPWQAPVPAPDADGVVTVEGLAPGLVSVKVSAAQFVPADEAASIVAGRTTELKVTLVPIRSRLPASLSGLVRSARGGAPVKARLEVLELKKVVDADARGSFATEAPGGKYTVRISAPGYLTQTRAVSVRDGDQVIFNVDLSPK